MRNLGKIESVAMPGRINVMSQEINNFRLLYNTFSKYYRVERLQTCCWLNKSKLFRALGKISTSNLGWKLSVPMPGRFNVMPCHKKSTICSGWYSVQIWSQNCQKTVQIRAKTQRGDSNKNFLGQITCSRELLLQILKDQPTKFSRFS